MKYWFKMPQYVLNRITYLTKNIDTHYYGSSLILKAEAAK